MQNQSNPSTNNKSIGYKIVVFLMLFLFCFALIFCYLNINLQNDNNVKDYNNKLSAINSFQYFYNNVNNNNNNPINTKDVLFDNGKDAVLNAINSLKTLNYWQFECLGKVKGTLGIDMTFTFYMKAQKYNNVIEHYIFMKSDVSEKFNSGQYAIYENGKIQEKYTTTVWQENEVLVGDFKDKPFINYNDIDYAKIKGNLPGEIFYIINNRTLKSTENFYVKKDIDNKVEYYYSGFSLNTNLSTYKYILFLKDKLHGGEEFCFDYITANMVIDSSGKVKSIKISDSYSFVYPIMFVNTKFCGLSCFNIEFSY